MKSLETSFDDESVKEPLEGSVVAWNGWIVVVPETQAYESWLLCAVTSCTCFLLCAAFFSKIMSRFNNE